MKKNFGPRHLMYPLPVLIVAAYNEDGEANCMNAAYGGILNKGRLQVNIGRRHKTAQDIMRRQAFTVAVADVKNMIAADYVGIVSGHEVPDKIQKAGWHTVKSEFVDAPVIEELPITMECRVEQIIQHEHTYRIVGEIVNSVVDESVLDENGGIDIAKLEPLAFDGEHAAYLKLGEKVGDAFSAGKEIG